MKINALHTYICPVSKGQLSLFPLESHEINLTSADLRRADDLKLQPQDLAQVIKTGILYSDASRKWYPIVNYVPLLIDYGTEIHQEFAAKYQSSSNIFQSYDIPNGVPRPGEDTIRKTFTKEWAALQFDNTSFGLTPEQRDFFIRLELDWPVELLHAPDLKLLEVGCGSGFESLSLDRVTQAEIYGIDLNVTLLRNGSNFAGKPFVNIASASLFAMPFRPDSFDVVYSSGVLHHTHSTKMAFEEILQYRKQSGSIYVWLYAREDVDSTIRTRINWILEEIFRPRLATMSAPLQNAIVNIMAKRHLKIYKKVGGYSKDLWTLANSKHFIRDRWTALFAYRHSFNEVIGWFLEHDLEYRLIDPKYYYDYFKVPLIGIGIRGVNVQRGAEQAEPQEKSKGKLQPELA